MLLHVVKVDYCDRVKLIDASEHFVRVHSPMQLEIAQSGETIAFAW